MGDPARRPWLVAVIVLVVAGGALFSWARRFANQPELDLHDGRPKLIELGMMVCAQCRKMRPVMARAKREIDAVDVHVLDVRVAANERLAERFQMRIMPLVVLVDGSGRQLWRHEGYVDFAEIQRNVRERLGARR